MTPMSKQRHKTGKMPDFIQSFLPYPAAWIDETQLSEVASDLYPTMGLPVCGTGLTKLRFGLKILAVLLTILTDQSF